MYDNGGRNFECSGSATKIYRAFQVCTDNVFASVNKDERDILCPKFLNHVILYILKEND